MPRERLWITGRVVYLPNRERSTGMSREMYRHWEKLKNEPRYEAPGAGYGLYLWGFLMMALMAGTLWLVLAVNGGAW